MLRGRGSLGNPMQFQMWPVFIAGSVLIAFTSAVKASTRLESLGQLLITNNDTNEIRFEAGQGDSIWTKQSTAALTNEILNQKKSFHKSLNKNNCSCLSSSSSVGGGVASAKLATISKKVVGLGSNKSFSLKQQNMLAADIGSLLMSDYLSDVTLLVGDVPIRAHKQILAARSPIFKRLIDDNPNKSTIEIRPVGGNGEHLAPLDINVDAFRLFLQYVYTGKISTHVRNVCAFYELAVMFEKNSLAARLAHFIGKRIAELSELGALWQLSDKSLDDIIKRHISKV